MNWKTIVACGMLLGLLSSVSFAQHQRLATGGTSPGARLPNATNGGGTFNRGITTGQGSITSTGRTGGIVQPNATSTPTSKTVSPNTSTIDPTAGDVRPNAGTVPNRVTVPDSTGLGNRTNVGPNSQ
jgi:hypothetical protein